MGLDAGLWIIIGVSISIFGLGLAYACWRAPDGIPDIEEEEDVL